MTSRPVLLAAIALVALGCRKKEPTATSGIDAAPSVTIAELPFAVIAEGPADLEAQKTTDDRILVVSGAMLFEAKPSGALESVVAPSEQAKLVPDDDTMTGYTTTYKIMGVTGALGSTLEISAAKPSHGPELFTYAGGKLTRGGRERDPLDVPDDVSLERATVSEGPNGSHIAVTFGKPIVVWSADGGAPRVLPLPHPAQSCTVMPSFAGKTVCNCEIGVYTLEGDRLVKTFERDDPYFPLSAGAAQDADGAIYLVANKERKIARCRGDACTTRELPETAPIRGAAYYLRATEFRRSEDGQYWDRLEVLPVGDEISWDGVYKVIARAPNDVWVFVRRGVRVQVLHTSPAPQKPKMLPSTFDARVVLRNTRPPSRWTSSCDQVYVRLGGNAEAITKREREIRAAVGARGAGRRDPLPWALVEGTLGDERSVGVVLSRNEPVQPIGVLEAAVKKLVNAFKAGPANEPSVFCTLPVLERRLLPE